MDAVDHKFTIYLDNVWRSFSSRINGKSQPTSSSSNSEPLAMRVPEAFENWICKFPVCSRHSIEAAKAAPFWFTYIYIYTCSSPLLDPGNTWRCLPHPAAFRCDNAISTAPYWILRGERNPKAVPRYRSIWHRVCCDADFCALLDFSCVPITR